MDVCVDGVDTFAIDAAIVVFQADDRETNAEVDPVFTKWTVDPTGVTPCATSSEGHE